MAGVFLHQLPASLAVLAALATLLAALAALLAALAGLLLLLAGVLLVLVLALLAALICHDNSYGIPLVLRDNVQSRAEVPVTRS
jgi:hypothetical protein